jgi:hypothetical protein
MKILTQDQINLILVEISRLRKQNDIDQGIELAHVLERSLLKFPKSHSLLQCYSELFNLYYLKGDLTIAFNYFSLTHPLIIEFGKWEDYTLFMQSIVKTTFFYEHKNEIESFIDRILPLAFKNEQFEVLSHCFVILSYIHLMKNEAKLAVQEAKLAYFYAQFVEEEKKKFVLCNAQLQLILGLLSTASLVEANYYIEEFNWYLDNCQNSSDVLLVQSVKGLIYLQNAQFDLALPILKNCLLAIERSNEIMYSTILSKHASTFISKYQDVMYENDLSELQHLCDTILGRYQMHTSTFMEQFTTFDESLINNLDDLVETPMTIFNNGQKLFEDAQNKNERLYCMMIQVNYRNLTKKGKIRFKMYLQEYNKLLLNKPFILTQYNHELIVLISKINNEEQYTFDYIANLKNTFPYRSTTVLYNPSNDQFPTFHEFFHYAFFTKLLNIELHLFNESLV